MESGQRASSRDPVAARRSLAVPLAPSSGTPPIRGVPNIGRSASSKHKTETAGMSNSRSHLINFHGIKCNKLLAGFASRGPRHP